MPGQTLVLASASPRRRALLERAGYEFEVDPAGVEEVEAGDPERAARENARRKARAVAARRPGRTVLGADTVVELDGRVLPKPAGPEQAAQWLRALSGRTHRVLGGICLVGPDGGEREALERTEVRFRKLTEEEIAGYVGTREWEGKAGGYAIQGAGGELVAEVAGSRDNVVGLPVEALRELLGDP